MLSKELVRTSKKTCSKAKRSFSEWKLTLNVRLTASSVVKSFAVHCTQCPESTLKPTTIKTASATRVLAFSKHYWYFFSTDFNKQYLVTLKKFSVNTCFAEIHLIHELTQQEYGSEYFSVKLRRRITFQASSYLCSLCSRQMMWLMKSSESPSSTLMTVSMVMR